MPKGEKLYELENNENAYRIPGSLSNARDELKSKMNEGKPMDFDSWKGSFKIHIATILAIKTLWPKEEKPLDKVYDEDGYDEYKKKTDETLAKKDKIKDVRNELLENRHDFKMMMDDVKTWEDAKKLTDMAIAPEAKQLVNHMATYKEKNKKLNENLNDERFIIDINMDQPNLQESNLNKNLQEWEE